LIQNYSKYLGPSQMADKGRTDGTDGTEMGAITDGGDSTEMYHLGAHRGM